MRIDLTTPEGERVVLAVNGTVTVEVCVGQVRTRDDLEREVAQARAALATVRGILPALCAAATTCHTLPGVDGMTPDKKGDAWARGLRDGLAGKRVPHPYGVGISSLAPDSSRPYTDGYGHGDALRRVAGLIAADAPLDLFSTAATSTDTEVTGAAA